MNLLLSLLFVAINPDAPVEVPRAEGIEVFHCPFDASWDKNFDGWPDGWTRRWGPGFPHYVTVEISEESSPVADRCLRFDLDGGGAAAYSPAIPVGPLYSYVVQGFVRTEGLRYDRAYFSLTTLDKDRRRLETFYSPEICGSHDWQKLRLGSITPGDDRARTAVIGLHLEPGAREDLKGVALFDDVRICRLPRIALAVDGMRHVFADPGEVTVRCKASGFTGKDAPVEFRLEDAWGALVAKTETRLQTTVPDRAVLSPDSPAGEPPGLIGSAQWKPPVPGPGFYRVWLTMEGDQMPVLRRELTLAVIEPLSAPEGGEFGWSLPGGGRPLPLPELGQLLGQAGIQWVKYPLWYDEQSGEEQIQEVIRFTEGLAGRGIEVVGLLDDPPESLRGRFGDPKSLDAAEIFAAPPEVWYPSLETVMLRMATRVRWWQLGRDRDTSYVGYPDLAQEVTGIKAKFDRIGRDVHLGFGWGWMNQLPEQTDAEPPWRFLTLSADPPLAPPELSDYLDATKSLQLERWTVLEPLSRERYSLRTRVDDLIRRIVSAKMHHAEGIFVPEPFSGDHGLMNADGTPGELFLPWRTSALLLSGSEYLGSIRLPNGSHNRIFSRGGEAVMVVWSEAPAREVVYLGDAVRQVDLWGRSKIPPIEGHRQVIEVDSLPTFVTGVDDAITRWRQGLSFDSSRVPSDFGRRHQNRFRLKNPFDRGVVGNLELIVPDGWVLEPRQTGFRLAGGESLEQAFEIALPYNVSSGRHPVRVDFVIRTDRTEQFSVYRHVDVGLADVSIDVATRLNPQGELEIEQRFVNDTEGRLSFRCHLFVPDRRRMMTEINCVGHGSDVKVYRLPNGTELIGKTLWLRGEQTGGPHVLNHRFVAEE